MYGKYDTRRLNGNNQGWNKIGNGFRFQYVHIDLIFINHLCLTEMAMIYK